MAVRWGLIGPGAIARNLADGLAQTEAGRLVAVCGRDRDRREAFAAAHGIAPRHCHAEVDDLLSDGAVDAVCIATPHPWHAALSIRALRAGKHVLCEKPAGLNAAEVMAVTEVAAQEDRFLMEAWMYLCHSQIARLLAIIAAGEIGAPLHLRAQFGFAARYDPGGRLFDPDLGGGAILDVGGYPVSLARLIAGAAEARPGADPVTVKGLGAFAPSGVDAVAHGLLGFASGFTAEIAVAITRAMDNRAVITGSAGQIVIDDPWTPGRDAGPSDATLHVTDATGATRREVLRDPRMLFAFEFDLASRAIAAGQREAPYPAPSHADSIGTAGTLDRWRAELGAQTLAERPASNRPLAGVLPRGLPRIASVPLGGVARPVSKLVIGCDNRATLAEGALVWDAWMEVGGTAFDTGFVYGGGLHERVLGDWIAARGVARDVVVIAKGAHTPYCTPGAIEAQLDISLDRLRLDHVPIYLLHRDNPAVPVDEFVDALNRLRDKGRIGIFGGSNWSLDRFAAANAHAAAAGLQGLSILNNNLSLAVMERPVWPGCVGANTPSTLAALRAGQVVHLSWSSQARGYFLPAALRDRLPADTAPETCFGSPANALRRSRAEALAAAKGVSAHNIATAWVLSQPFPSLAIIGPRSPGEIATTLPGAALVLSPAELAWLNLEDRAEDQGDGA